MNRFSKTHVFLFFLILLLSMACSFGPRSAVSPEPDEVATFVAATVQAMVKPQPQPVGVNPTAPAPTGLPSVAPTTAAKPASAETPSSPVPLLAAYTDSNRNLWAWKEDGVPVQLVNSGDVIDVCVSPDGQLIAFTKITDPSHSSLMVIHPDGTDLRTLVSSSNFESMPNDPNAIAISPAKIRFLPGSHSLLFNTRPEFEGPGMALNNDLWTLNADNGEWKNLLPRGQGGSFIISPNGNQIAIVTPDSISLINVDGSNPRKAILKYTPVATYSEYAYYAEPRWAADSNSLKVVIPASASLENTNQPSIIWNIPSDGSAAVEIGSIVTAPLVWAILSPDLQKVMYISRVGDPNQNQGELRVANSDGTGSTVYQTGQLSLEGWSPDSKQIVYTDTSAKTSYISQAVGSSVSIKGGVLVNSPLWLDASRFIALIKVGSGWEIHLATIEGESQLIASLPGGDGTGWPVIGTNRIIP